MRRPRRLSPGEIALWRAVAETVEARPGSRLPELPPIPAAPVQAAPPAAPAEPPRPSYYAAPYRPPSSAPKAGPTGIARRDKRRIASGLIGVDATLDLHGFTQAEAHAAVRGFLTGAQRDGAKLVIIVTGKGLRPRLRAAPAESGVLRRAVPHWLRDPALSGVVLSFEEAAHRHGGAGALYVRLRRPEI